jgi:hypothetical protein
MGRLAEVFSFPHPVNETSARVVAGGVVAMSTATVALDQPWLMVPLTYGFAARVASGPTLSPLGQIATRVVTPRIRARHRFVPGPPKRLAQAMGLLASGTATTLYYGYGKKRAAYSVLAALIAAAGLEAFFGICLACKMFSSLASRGFVPEAVCEKCADLSSRPSDELLSLG